MTGPRPSLAVVVMGYLDAGTIVRAVRSVVDQAPRRDPADAVEVVVVTSGDDDTEDRVRRAFPDLRVVAAPHRLLPGGARNAGLAATEAPLVAFLAGDCEAEPGWIAGRLRAHRAGHPVVAGAVTNGDRSRPAAWGYHFATFPRRLAARPAGPVPATDAAAHGCSFERTVLDAIGRFDPAVRVGEDTDVAAALAARGVPIWFEPAVRTRHRGPRTTVALFAECAARGRQVGAERGPAATSRRGVVRLLRAEVARTPRVWREAGADRWWFLATLPWSLAAQAVFVVARQRAGRRLPRASP